jgi:DNA-binding NarL/FixJ family response regulator
MRICRSSLVLSLPGTDVMCCAKEMDSLYYCDHSCHSNISFSATKKAFCLKRITILLIEDNSILRDGIKSLINAQSDLKIAAASAGNRDTLTQARELKPQVVLMDLGLRNENGLRVVKALTMELPQVKVIGMGLIPSQQDIIELVEAGAAGFILKDATIEEFLGTIRSVAQGMKILPPLLTGSLFTHVVEHALRKGNGKLPGAVRITKREREIIVLIAEGMSNKEIGQRLNLSTYTVKSHIHNILEKMALHSRLEIAVQSFELKTT